MCSSDCGAVRGGRCGCARGAVVSGARSASAGLVPTSTTVTRVDLDPVSGRLSRMRRSILTTAAAHSEDVDGFRARRAAMVTFTYRPGCEWRPEHLSDYVRRVREWHKRRTSQRFRYVWVLELTKAGVPHYHMVIWLPRGLSLPKPDKAGHWSHGSTRIEWAKRAVSYLAKYVSKAGPGLHAGAMPSGARLYGSGGLSAVARSWRAWRLSPGWVRAIWTVEDRPRRAAGGGWVARASGEWMPSRFWLLGASAALVVLVERWTPVPWLVPAEWSLKEHLEGCK